MNTQIAARCARPPPHRPTNSASEQKRKKEKKKKEKSRNIASMAKMDILWRPLQHEHRTIRLSLGGCSFARALNASITIRFQITDHEQASKVKLLNSIICDTEDYQNIDSNRGMHCNKSHILRKLYILNHTFIGTMGCAFGQELAGEMGRRQMPTESRNHQHLFYRAALPNAGGTITFFYSTLV